MPSRLEVGSLVLSYLARLTGAFALALSLTCCPDATYAASAESPQQSGQRSSEGAAPKSEAAEAWDAVKTTTNPALLEAFIKRYGTTFFAEMAKARLEELKAAAAKTHPRAPSLPPMPKNREREHAVLYEEDPTDARGRRFDGSVIWSTETIKTPHQPDELAARADIEIPSRGLRMKMSIKRNLDPALPASHVVELMISASGDFDAGGIANIPGMLMKANEQAAGTPFAGLAVRVTDGFFLVGLSNVPADRARNLKLLLERSWFDIPTVYANQKRAILAIEKGETGDQVFKTVLTAWGQYQDTTQGETAAPDESNNTMPDEWKRTMMGRPKAR
ncbi:MAG TPA: hypothetical protein VFB05_24180 [Bradyrhizobium sp.]|nr:hypothetical protein [Bradyrhizobium sp.]